MNKNNKLQISIKGKALELFHKWYVQLKAKKHGVKTHSAIYTKETVELIFEGERKNLWNMINSHKRSNIFINTKELTFHFEECSVSTS